MAKSQNPDENVDRDKTQDSGFDLAAPTSAISRAGQTEIPDPQPPTDAKVDPRLVADSRSRPEWKGLETEEEFEPEVDFGAKGIVEDELDMTPMVDVVFLLLIFFMVTASFTLQKSIAQPPVPDDEPSTIVEEVPEDEDQYVEVIIDQFNTYRLTSKDQEETEAPSDQEMRVRLRDMISSTDAKKLKITAHGDAHHEKVVTVWDAGVDNDIQDIVIRLSEEDY
ncbi:MAG: ExbD/TolR family protein [Pirellulaceae bacterium]